MNKKYRTITDTYFNKTIRSNDCISDRDLSYSKFDNVNICGEISNCKMDHCEIINDPNINNINMDIGGYFFCSDLSYSVFSNLIIRDFTFKGTHLDNTIFKFCDFDNCTFKDCSFSGSSIDGCSISNCKFINTDFIDCKFNNTQSNNDTFICNFSKSTFYCSYFYSNFHHSILSDTNIENAVFYKITNSDFRNSKIIKSRFDVIKNSNLSNSTFITNSFRDSDCSDSIFTNTSFIECNVYNMNIKNSNLTFENLDNESVESIKKYCPTDEFIAWKLAYYIESENGIKNICILKVLVPQNAKRKYTTGNIITVSKVKVLEIIDYYNHSKHIDCNNTKIVGIYNNDFKYKLNEISISKSYDDEFTDRGYGIHVVYNHKNPDELNDDILKKLSTTI